MASQPQPSSPAARHSAAAQLAGRPPQRLVPGGPGGSLLAGAAVPCQVGGGEGLQPGVQAERLGVVDHEGGVGRRAGPEAVVDGHHRQPPAARAGKRPHGVQQGERVGPAGDGRRQPVAGGGDARNGEGPGGPVGDQAERCRRPGHGRPAQPARAR